jgi:hypothetical protein
MRYRNVYAIAPAALGLGLAFAMGVAVGERAPTENKGVKIYERDGGKTKARDSGLGQSQNPVVRRTQRTSR